MAATFSHWNSLDDRPGQVALKDSAIRVLAVFVVLPQHEEEVQDLLRRLRSKALSSAGYQLGTVWQDVAVPYRLVAFESWQTLEHYLMFQGQEETRQFMKQIKSCLAMPPQVSLLQQPHSE